MKRVEFKTYEDFICEVVDKLEAIVTTFDRYGDICIIAKSNEANVIIRELLCMGYNIASVHLGKENYEEYIDEYIISITYNNGEKEIWCEPFKRNNKYLTDESLFTYVMDNCSSACIPNCKGRVLFEVGIVDDEECDCDECQCACKEETDDKVEYDVKSDDNGYFITVRCNLDADEAMEMIQDMENRMQHIKDMFCEMNEWQKLFRW